MESGKAGGGLCYGYRVVRTLNGSTVTTGEREIEPTEAAIVQRIFREFIAGHSPKQIAKMLNREGISGPFGGKWSPSTIHGNPKRGTGILNNELYIGRMVWNRLRYVKNPDTGKRVSRLSPTSEWITTDVPHLRIVPDELWSVAQLAAADAPPPLLHPNLAALYREKVATLASALQNAGSRSEAAEALRGLVDAIELTPAPGGEDLGVELRGCAALLGATVQSKKVAKNDDLSLQVSLVAGACNRRYLQLWSGAA